MIAERLIKKTQKSTNTEKKFKMLTFYELTVENIFVYCGLKQSENFLFLNNTVICNLKIKIRNSY